jgi:malate synthase
MRDAVRRTISLEQNGKQYKLNDKVATLVVRPRGWHLDEKHVLVDGKRISGGIFDFALFMFHNAKEQLARGAGPYFYLPKMESHLEARLWNDIFKMTQDELGLPQGTIKATVLIETILAAFEMDEILYELREHSAGLNAGRWDYIFSCIKKFKLDKDFCLADRPKVTMTAPFMRAYALLLLKTCHKRGAPAIGGMSALIPIKNDPEKNATAMAGVIGDKSRDATDGYDGGWVAHPGLVEPAMTEFKKVLGDRPNQFEKQRPDVEVTAAQLLDFKPEAPITEAGLRYNINVGIHYLGAWLAGNGCVPIHNLMEDAATAEISRSQVWQWIRTPKGVLDDGRKVTAEMVRAMIPEELAKVKGSGAERRQPDLCARGGDLREDVDVGGVCRVPDLAAVRRDLIRFGGHPVPTMFSGCAAPAAAAPERPPADPRRSRRLRDATTASRCGRHPRTIRHPAGKSAPRRCRPATAASVAAASACLHLRRGGARQQIVAVEAGRIGQPLQHGRVRNILAVFPAGRRQGQRQRAPLAPRHRAPCTCAAP